MNVMLRCMYNGRWIRCKARKSREQDQTEVWEVQGRVYEVQRHVGEVRYVDEAQGQNTVRNEARLVW